MLTGLDSEAPLTPDVRTPGLGVEDPSPTVATDGEGTNTVEPPSDVVAVIAWPAEDRSPRLTPRSYEAVTWF
jgi:hypothetical protein